MTEIRHVSEETVAHIKYMAEGGFSIHAISKALIMDRKSLIRVLTNHNIKTKVWDYVDRIRGYKDADNTNRILSIKKTVAARVKKHTIRGVTATFSELVSQFAVVSIDTVRARMGRGFTMEAAIFAPSMQLSALRENNRIQSLNKNSMYRKTNNSFFIKSKKTSQANKMML